MNKINLLYEGFIISTKKHKKKTAIIYENEIWSYETLNYYVNGIRKKLTSIKDEHKIIAVIGKKSNLVIATLLAILEEGYSYLPIDINYPKTRIEYILKNSNVKNVILFDNDILFTSNGINIIKIEKENFYKYDLPVKHINTNDNAYVIYTSGSTGKPNGVIISHQNICNTINWRTEFYKMNEKTTILQFASLSFDSSVEDIFCALTCSGTLVIPNEDKKLNLNYLVQLINKHSVTHMLLIPSVYFLLLKKFKKEYPNTLKEVVLAGEDINPQILIDHFTKSSQTALYNEYGPTENSVCTSVSKLSIESSINIGKPISGVAVHILDENNIPVKDNKKGILFVGGKGVAKGYLNNDQITNQKFIYNSKAERLYCTGDVVYYDDDKNLIFAGRMDNEIKINGIRINLDEITSAINKHFNFLDICLCTTFMLFNSKKIALVISNKDIGKIDKIHDFLLSTMPKYFIPQYIYIINTVPTLPNYKVDKKRLNYLIAKDLKGIDTMREDIINKLQEIITKYSVTKISLDNDLLESGIDSLSLVNLLIDIEEEFDIEIDLTDKKMDNNFTINFICNLIAETKKQRLRKL